jgi:acetyl-CoA carboxylase/biotin carboxylase 1
MPSVDKLSLLATESEPYRQGVMFASQSLGSLEDDLRKCLAYLPNTKATLSIRSIEAVNVCNAALLVYEAKDDKPDDEWQRILCDMATRLNGDLEKRGVRRITFSICRRGQYPSYFTIRKGDRAWEESSTIRDIEPALAYQLELERLSNFKITPVGVENHQIHTYYGVAKTNPSDCRFFIRTIVRPNRLRGGMREVDYLVRGSVGSFKVMLSHRADCGVGSCAKRRITIWRSQS